MLTQIEEVTVKNAILLMDDYFLKQANHVRQTAAIGDGEADAKAVLAILRQRDWRDCFMGRQLQRVASGRLADTRNRKAACEILVEAGLLFWKPERKGTGKGREREEYHVNPIVFGIKPAAAPEDPTGVQQIKAAA